MKLQFEISKENLQLCQLQENEEIYYSLPLDIDREGNFRNNSFTVITDQRIIILEEGVVTHEYRHEECEKVLSEPRISSGVFFVVCNGQTTYLGRFSAKHLTRYSYMARGCLLLRNKIHKMVESSEYETTCERCGRALPGTRECPNCSGKKADFIHVFWGMLRSHKPRLLVILIFMLLAAAVTLINPAIQRILIDDVLKNHQGTWKEAAVCLALIFLMSVGIVIINVTKSYLCFSLGSIISAEQRKKLYEKIQILSLSFLNERTPGELMNRISQDTARIRDFLGDTFCNMFTVSIIFLCDIVYMLILDWKLALITFSFIPVATMISIGFWNNIHRRFHMQRVMSDKLNSNLQDVISGIAVVKSYGKEQEESQHFNDVAQDFSVVQRKNETFWAIFFPMLNFIMGGGVFLATYFGGASVLSGFKSTGELVQFITYTTLLYQYVGWLSNMPRMLMDMVTSVERIGDVMCQEPGICDDDSSVMHEIVGNIEFKNASFGYKSYQPILEDINLKIKKGEMIGLVGASGTGKSTLINLIMHLYEVDDGELLIDETNIRNIKLEDYHSQIGVVLQETFLFSGTILNNIRYAKPEATMEEIIRVAKMANAHDFICKTPDGYNTYVGEKGFNLSGGERQRIAIARAILNDPKILILDEATASLDTESEYLVQKALKRLTEGRTTLAIAHRLSTLKDADRLVVIDGHSIAEVGTHDELVARKGIYYGLVRAQLQMQGTKVALES